MRYDVVIRREEGYLLAEFPDCAGCQTFSRDEESLRAAAAEALEGWLEAHLVSGQAPPRPRARKRAPRGARLWRIAVDPVLAVPLQIRWARKEAGLTQTELAKKARVSQQQVAKLEHPGENPTIAVLKRVAAALEVELEVNLVAA